jgi:hypothetical protein
MNWGKAFCPACFKKKKKLSEESHDLRYIKAVSRRTEDYASGFHAFQSEDCARTVNSVAHKLAMEGCKKKVCKTWFSEAPGLYSGSLVRSHIVYLNKDSHFP